MNRLQIKFILKTLLIVFGMVSLLSIFIIIGVLIIFYPIVRYGGPTIEFYLTHLGIPENDNSVMYSFFCFLICHLSLLLLTVYLVKERINSKNMSKVKTFFEKHFPLFYFIFRGHKELEVKSAKKVYILQEVNNGYPDQPQLFNSYSEVESEYLRLAYYFAISCLGPCRNLEPFRTTEEAVNFFDTQEAYRKSRGYHLKIWALDEPSGEHRNYILGT